jgi:hypothetical protein
MICNERREIRLSLAFCRELVILKAVVALYFWSYNFCLIHRALRMTPAMAAGISDWICGLKDLVSLKIKIAHYQRLARGLTLPVIRRHYAVFLLEMRSHVEPQLHVQVH